MQNRIDTHRNRLGLSLSALARKLETDRSHLSEVRAGRRRLSLTLAVRLERLTGDKGFIEDAARSVRAQA